MRRSLIFSLLLLALVTTTAYGLSFNMGQAVQNAAASQNNLNAFKAVNLNSIQNSIQRNNFNLVNNQDRICISNPIVTPNFQPGGFRLERNGNFTISCYTIERQAITNSRAHVLDQKCYYEVPLLQNGLNLSTEDRRFLMSTINYSTPNERALCANSLLQAAASGRKPMQSDFDTCNFGQREHNSIEFLTFPAKSQVCSGSFNGRRIPVDAQRQREANGNNENNENANVNQQIIREKLELNYPVVVLVDPPGCFAAINNNGDVRLVNSTTGKECNAQISERQIINALLEENHEIVPLVPIGVSDCFLVHSNRDWIHFGNCAFRDGYVGRPSFTSVRATAHSSGFELNWSTNRKTNYTINVVDKNASLAMQVLNSSFSTSHFKNVTGLLPNENYVVNLTACHDFAGPQCTYRLIRVRTLPLQVVAPPLHQNLEILNFNLSIGVDNANLTWQTSQPASYTALLYSSQNRLVTIRNSFLFKNLHEIRIPGLLEETSYALTIRTCTITNNCAERFTQFTTLNSTRIADGVQSENLTFENLQFETSNASISITWSTNLPANSTLVNFNSTDALTHYVLNATYDQSHFEVLLGLTPNETYKFGILACTQDNMCATITRSYNASANGNLSIETPQINFSINPNPFLQQDPIAPSENAGNGNGRDANNVNRGGSGDGLALQVQSGPGRSIFKKYGCEMEFGNGTLGDCTENTTTLSPATGIPVASSTSQKVENVNEKTASALELLPKGAADETVAASENKENLLDIAIAALILLLVALVAVSAAAYMLHKQKQENQQQEIEIPSEMPASKLAATEEQKIDTNATEEQPGLIASIKEQVSEQPTAEQEVVKSNKRSKKN